MNHNRHKLIKIIGWVLFLLGIGFFCLQMGFLVVQARFNVEYVDNRLFYIINMLCLICLMLAIWLLLKLTKELKIIGIIISIVFITANVFMLVTSHIDIKNITSVSPNFSHVLSIKKDTVSNEAIYYRSYYGILARPHDRLPHKPTSDLKTEWLANDVVAVTYQTADDSIQQYIGTYGDRGGGTAYYNVGPEIQGAWQGESAKLISSPEGISVTENGKTELFDWDNIHQFGTLAIVLTKGDEAVWTVSLNENFEVHSDASEPMVGNITLYQATMANNQPITLDYQGTYESLISEE
ncbi:hypothetical protein ACS127_14405 [Amphibacillus sp. Q70]|uniref:hypothetical protein n=1 Tax=Amphibacillus sp. Q70 TaxID=3453416 RepID=UPI003F85BBA8